MKYDLKKPCSQCPFRTDIDQIPLTSAFAVRVQEMVKGILDGNLTFACHQTNEYDEMREGVDGDKTNFCAGAMIMLTKLGKKHEELEAAKERGEYTADDLDLDAPVFDSPEAMFEAMRNALYDR